MLIPLVHMAYQINLDTHGDPTLPSAPKKPKIVRDYRWTLSKPFIMFYDEDLEWDDEEGYRIRYDPVYDRSGLFGCDTPVKKKNKCKKYT